jgi:predicted  nucleic acid-binding Zn-ribbon protein
MTAVPGLLLLAVLALAPGCQSKAPVTDHRDIAFEIRPSTREIVAGEIVTLTTRSENLLGRDATIEWRTTGGKLTTEDNNRIARVRIDEPGTYTIGARLIMNGREVMTDDTTVTVRPVR